MTIPSCAYEWRGREWPEQRPGSRAAPSVTPQSTSLLPRESRPLLLRRAPRQTHPHHTTPPGPGLPPSVARWLPTHASPASESAHDPRATCPVAPRASLPPANAGSAVRWRRRAAVLALVPFWIPPPLIYSSTPLTHRRRTHPHSPPPRLFKASDMLFSRRPLAAALHLSTLSPPLLVFFASASSSASSCFSAASASGPRGCSAVRMETGAVEPASTGAIWSTPSVEPRSISIGKQIFCNRSLNMKNITAVGFDMDYTLAQYKPETFEALAYHGTIEKLVKDLNYPEELLTWQFDWKYMVRGLVLDKKRGNILKMDRHKYVKVAYHGFREMSKEEKVFAYGSTLIRDSFDEPDYALIDTLFSLGEAYLFAQLVDFMDNNPGKVPSGTNYPLMYRDVRSAVDMCHRDGTLKRMVAKDPRRYINEDLAIVPMLQMIRKSGCSTFLVTNSLWDYTDVVMNYLCGPYISDVGSGHNHNWLDYFDVVITGSSKPGFFHDDNRAGLFEVEPDSGKLLNADLQIGSPRSSQQHSKPIHKVYQGGNVGHLHRLLSVASSSQILYVGDHIYGDILRSKKVLGWRTMLVIPELEQEVKLLSESKSTRKELRHLRMERDSIEDRIHRLEWSLNFENLTENEKRKLLSEHDNLLKKREHVRGLHQDAQRQHHQKFHKVWGQLMKTGYQNSRFAHQVERFACLYSSQVTNFGLYSPNKYYRPSEDYLPHEFDVLGLWEQDESKFSFGV